MRNNIFKRIFEVRILHDYYLLSENKSFFDQPPDQQRKIIEKRIQHNLLDLRKDLKIYPTAATKSLMERHKMGYFQTPLGFVATIEVVSKFKDGAVRYKPRFNLPLNSIFHYNVEVSNPYFNNLTEGRLRSRFDSIYYFTNQVIGQSPGILASPIADWNPDLTYEMGDLAIINGQLKQAVRRCQDNTASNWHPRSGQGLVHAGDRCLLPTQSAYRFPPSLTDQNATAKLINLDGQTFKVSQGAIESNLRSLNLDFRKDSDGNEIKNGKYNLQIQGDHGYIDEKEVIIDDQLYNPYLYGIIGISDDTENLDNMILDQDGFLSRPSPNETHPIFEIRLRSRSTYWRYVMSEDIAGAPDHLIFEPIDQQKILISEKPRSLSSVPTSFPAQPPALAEKMYPNPETHPLKEQTDGRIFSDLNINTIQKLTN